MSNAHIIFSDNPLYQDDPSLPPVVSTTVPSKLGTGNGDHLTWFVDDGNKQLGIPKVTNIVFNSDLVTIEPKHPGGTLPIGPPVNKNGKITADVGNFPPGPYPYNVMYDIWQAEDPELDVSGTFKPPRARRPPSKPTPKAKPKASTKKNRSGKKR